MTDDMELLREYVATDSEEAFAALTRQHINMVYSVAFRHIGNAHHAEEITQAVFIILAKKAARLSPNTVLSGWLFHTARLTAANFLKIEMRRINREQEAYMQSLSDQPENENAIWQQISTALDEAIASLNEKDRNAVVLRFIEGKNLREVGEIIGASEDAAKVRVARALEKLRRFFTKRGVTLSGAALATIVSSNAVQAAPVGLASSVASVAALKGAAASSSTLLLTKGTMKVMTWLKIKAAAVGIAVTVFVAGSAAVAITHRPMTRPAGEEIVQKAQAAYAAMTSFSCTGKTVANVNGTEFTHTYTIKLARPNLYRVLWAQAVTPSFTNSGAAWSAGDGDFLIFAAQKTKKQKDRETNLGTAAGISGSASHTIPGTFFGGRLDALKSFSQSADFVRETDEQIGGVDCYVLSGTQSIKEPKTKFTYWIGKQDALIHQCRTVVKNFQVKMPGTGQVSTSDITSIQTFENMVPNDPLSKSDFEYQP